MRDADEFRRRGGKAQVTCETEVMTRRARAFYGKGCDGRSTRGGVMMTLSLSRGRRRAIGVDTTPVTVQSVAARGLRAMMVMYASTYEGAPL